jgi:hypothetical protein
MRSFEHDGQIALEDQGEVSVQFWRPRRDDSLAKPA